MGLLQNKLVRWLGLKFLLRNPRWRLHVTKMIVKDEDKDIALFGGRLRVNTIKEIGYLNAHVTVSSNVVLRDEVGSLLSLALLLEPSDTFVDIGANVGLYSVLLGRLQRAVPRARYYAFEANPDTFGRLTQSLKGTRTECTCIALSENSGTLEFSPGATSGVFGATASASDFQMKDAVVRMEARRLDSFELEGGSLVLKIDVEGHEWEVLVGAEGLFRANRIKAVYLDGAHSDRIPAYLTGFGFRLFDGRTMVSPPTQDFSMLWINERWLAQWDAPKAR